MIWDAEKKFLSILWALQNQCIFMFQAWAVHYTLSQFIVLSHLNSFNDNTYNCDRTIAIDEMQISKIS